MGWNVLAWDGRMGNMDWIPRVGWVGWRILMRGLMVADGWMGVSRSGNETKRNDEKDPLTTLLHEMR